VAEIESLIQQRLDARKAKDWAAADAARDRLNEMGIVLEDGPQGTTAPEVSHKKTPAKAGVFLFVVRP
jgi:cysteinyl-tRNA synthetase